MPLTISPTQITFNARGDGKFNRPFQPQVDFFQQKLNLPSEHYDDIIQSAHDRAFIVAGATKADLLADLREAVDKAIVEGKSIGWFRKEFDAIVQKHGWEGWTGSDTKAGRDWRTRIIYNTNLSASYAAGRWQQLNDPELLKVMPYWKYVHNDTVRHPRPLHKAWSGLVLRHDDSWWQTHFPPNGWGCRCRVTAVTAREFKGDITPDGGTWVKKDRWGNSHEVPAGIDYGWDYAPGATVANVIKQVKNKLPGYPDVVAKALRKDIAKIEKPVFQPAKSVKEAEKYLVANDIVDYADFGKIKDVALVNEWNEPLFKTIKEFPELRKNQQFTGTCQAQYSAWYENELKVLKNKLLVMGYTENDADFWARKRIKKPIVTDRWAHSSVRSKFSGIAINEKYSASKNGIDALKSGLQSSMASGFHPPGCDTIKSIVDHELGHQLDELLNIRQDHEVLSIYNSVKATINKEVSGYASTNIAEFIAECWAEFRNSKKPRDISSRIGKIISARYAAKYNY
jgi:hypothetical protein